MSESRLKSSVFDESGNHQLIDTGHKTFDRQVGGLTTGNIIDNVQYGSFIRAFAETMCWGPDPFPPGHLQDYDLKHFEGLPHRVRDHVKHLARDKGVILYEFHHWKPIRRWGETTYQKHVHGYIVTEENYKLIDVYVTGSQYHKSAQLLYAVAPYVSWREE